MTALFDLTGKTALVTGASRGIGRAVALGYAEAGADLALLARGRAALDEVAALAEKFGRRALVLPCDVGDGEQVRTAAATALAELGRIDVLVNNAAVVPAMGPFAKLKIGDFATAYRVNFESVVHLCQALGPQMLERGCGSVLNVASVAGTLGTPMLSAYAASKAALISLTRTLAAEWAASGVRVNALVPGWIDTDMASTFARRQELSDSLMRSVPSGRWGRPEDLVGLAIYLAADCSRLVTGACMALDGGLTSYAGGPTLIDMLRLGRVAAA